MRAVCSLVIPAVLLLLSAARGAEGPSEPSAQVKEKLGEATVALLRNANRVEVFRIKPIKPDKSDERNIGGYTITATGKEQPKEFAAKLAEVLLSDKTYFGAQDRCFLPGVAFRLWTEKKESAEVIVCFGCTNLRLASHDADGKDLKSVSGAFGPDLAPLLKLAKEAFPDDQEIQNISEEKK